MDCHRIKEFLEENFLADGYQLPPEIEEHIGNCPECRAAYEEMLALSETLLPLTNIALTPAEAIRFERDMSRAIEEIDVPKKSYIPENRIFSIARLGLAAAAVLIMMMVSYSPNLPSGLTLLQNAEIWQTSQIETEDMAQLFANGETDLLPSSVDDQTAIYLTEQIPAAQAEGLLENLTAEELEWLQENLTVEI